MVWQRIKGIKNIKVKDVIKAFGSQSTQFSLKVAQIISKKTRHAVTKINIREPKTLILPGSVLLMGLVFIYLSFIILSSLFKSTTSQNHTPYNITNNLEILSRYYFYPPEKTIRLDSKEYIISPESVDLSKDKKNIEQDIFGSDLFEREGESIQNEINKLY